MAQDPTGRILGRVWDKDFAEPLADAQVTVIENGARAATDAQGTFRLPDLPPGRYTLSIGKDGYLRQSRDLTVTAGRLTELEVWLQAEVTDLEEFVVADNLQLGGGSESALLQVRLQSASFLDAIGSDLIGRSGASDAAAALRLVAGASVQDGRSAVIRGLPDRYVSAQLNGVRLPTANEDKRAVELDQFPSAIIESLRVSKTFTPDQQGDASGGAVDIRLKGIPDEPFFFKWSVQTSHNTQVTGRGDFLTYQGGGLGYLGRDGGRRRQQLDQLGEDWSGAVGTVEGEAPLDYKWSSAIGGRHEIAEGVRLGASGSFFYERDSSLRRDAVDDSWWVESPGAPMTPKTAQGTVQDGDFKTSLFDVRQAAQSVQWGALGVIGLETDHHALSLTWLRTTTAEDTATVAEDTRGKAWFFPGHDPDDPTTPGHDRTDAAPYLRLETLAYSERTMDSVQLAGRHRLDLGGDSLPPELDWVVSRSEAASSEPDKRQFGSLWVPGRTVGPFVIPAAHRPFKPSANFTLGNLQRIWKDIEEDSEQYSVNLRLPFRQWDDHPGHLKFGVFEDRVHRTFDQDTFSNFNDNSGFDGPWQQQWSSTFPFQSHPITPSVFDVDYEGRQHLSASYVMLDLPLLERVNLVGGLRLERTRTSIVNDPESGATWYPPGSLAPTQLNAGDGDVQFGQHDVLPAVGLVWRTTDTVTMRASYGETVARQTFKELSPILQQEFLGGPIFIGNPELQMSDLRNYDLRVDWTPYDGGMLSASWFRKDIRRPIEYVQRIASFDFTTAVNYPRGRIDGLELEARQQLGHFWRPLEGLGIGANATWLDARVSLPDDEIAGFDLPGIQAPMSSREMTNAPEALYNAFVTYDLEATGSQLAVFYTVQGDSLVAGAGQSSGNFVPSVYADDFDTLNASFSQALGRHVRLQLGAKNLTDPLIREVYRSPYIDGDVVRSSHRNGIDLTFGIGGEIRF